MDGEDGVLDIDPAGHPYALLPTKEALELWEEGDPTMARCIVLGGFGVEGGTRVKHTGGSLMYMKLLVLEGPHAGHTGWITKGAVHKGHPPSSGSSPTKRR